MVRIVVEANDLRAALRDTLSAAHTEAAAAISAATLTLRDQLRAQVVAAGLGEHLAKTWKVKAPRADSPLAAGNGPVSARVYSTAAVIIDAFDRGVTIRGRNGNGLAIPTDRVPRRPGRGRGRRLTPVEVEARFNRDLRFVPPRAGRHALLVMDDLVTARSGRGVRAATSRRRAQGRTAGAVVMFILVPQVTLAKRLDIAAVITAVAAEYPDLTISPLP